MEFSKNGDPEFEADWDRRYAEAMAIANSQQVTTEQPVANMEPEAVVRIIPVTEEPATLF